MQELKDRVKVNISFSFNQIQTNLKGNLQLSLAVKCDNLIYNNDNKKFDIQNGRSLLFQLFQVSTTINPSDPDTLDKDIYVDVYTHSWNSKNLFGTFALKPFKDRKYDNHWNLALDKDKEFIKVIFRTKITSQQQIWVNQESKIQDNKSSIIKARKKSQLVKSQVNNSKQVYQLLKQNERIKNQLQKCQQNVSQLSQQLKKVESDNQVNLQKLTSKNNFLQQKLSKQLNILLFKETEIEQLKKQKEKIARQSQKSSDLGLKRNQITQKLQELTKSNVYLLDEIKKLQSKNRKLEEQIQILAVNFDNSLKIIEEKRQTVLDLTNEIKDLQKKLQQKNKQNLKLLSSEKQHQYKQIDFTKQYQAINVQCQRNRLIIAQQERIIAQLKKGFEQTERQLTIKIEELVKNVKEIHQQDIKRKKIIQTYQNQIHLTKDTLETITGLLNQQATAFNCLMQKVFKHLTQFDKAQMTSEQIMELQKSAAFLSLQELKIQDKISQITKYYREKILNLQQENQVITLQLNKAKQFFAEAIAQNKILNINIEEHKQDRQKLSNELKEAKDLFLELSQTQVHLNDQIKKQQICIAYLRQQIQSLKGQKVQIGNKYAQLQRIHTESVKNFQDEKQILINLSDQSLIQVKRICLQLQKKILRSETRISETQVALQIQTQKSNNLKEKLSYLTLLDSGLNEEVKRLSQELFLHKNKSAELTARNEQLIAQVSKLMQEKKTLVKLVKTIQQQFWQKQSSNQKSSLDKDLIIVKMSHSQKKPARQTIQSSQDFKIRMNPQNQQTFQESKRNQQLKNENQSFLYENRKQQVQKNYLQQKLKRHLIIENEQKNQVNRLKLEVKQLKLQLQKNEMKIAFVSQAKANFENDIAKSKDLEKELFRLQRQMIIEKQKKLQIQQKFNKKAQQFAEQKRNLIIQINQLRNQIRQNQKSMSLQADKLQDLYSRQLKEIKAQLLLQRQSFTSIMQSLQRQNECKLDEVRRQIQKMFQCYSFSEQTKVQLKQQVKQCHEIMQRLVKQKQNLENRAEEYLKKSEKLKKACLQREQDLKSMTKRYEQALKISEQKVSKSVQIQAQIFKQKLKQWIKRKAFDLKQLEQTSYILKCFQEFQQKSRQFLQEMIIDLS